MFKNKEYIMWWPFSNPLKKLERNTIFCFSYKDIPYMAFYKADSKDIYFGTYRRSNKVNATYDALYGALWWSTLQPLKVDEIRLLDSEVEYGDVKELLEEFGKISFHYKQI